MVSLFENKVNELVTVNDVLKRLKRFVRKQIRLVSETPYWNFEVRVISIERELMLISLSPVVCRSKSAPRYSKFTKKLKWVGTEDRIVGQ